MSKGKSSIRNQMEKLFKHARQGSYGTRAKYKQDCSTFISFLEREYKMQNLKNLDNKHLAAYVKYRQEEGISPKQTKNDLTAIRYMHDMIHGARYELMDNKELQKTFEINLEKTPSVKGNRAWDNKEFEAMQQLARELVQSRDPVTARTAKDFLDVSLISRTMGLRIAEAALVSRAQAERALRTNVYHVGKEAKNGKERDVPLSREGREVLVRKIAQIDRRQRLFVNKGEKSHRVINRLEKFLERHREKVETEEGKKLRTFEDHNKEVVTNRLTFHGLRYSYIQDRMKQEMNKGLSWEKAAAIVTKEVGHERIVVIKVYQGGTTFGEG